MAPSRLEPATLAFDDDGVAYAPRYGDRYHPQVGAFEQAEHVFLGGNLLPSRWAGRQRFVVLETGFGLGNNFLATWAAWRADPGRCAQLVFISVEAHPLTRVDLDTAHQASREPVLAHALVGAWPALTPDLHCLDFDAGRVRLLLALGDVQRWLPQLRASVDAFFLDGFAPACNPRMWDERVVKALSRLAAQDATLATWTAAGTVRRHLVTAGFVVRAAPGIGGKREITLARFAPVFLPRGAGSRVPADTAVSAPAPDVAPAPTTSTPTPTMSMSMSMSSPPTPSLPHPVAAAAADREPHAVIVGAGLAGCAAAWALAELGWRSTLIECRAEVAQEASGNPAGLFHGIVNAQDGLHARFNRAAALMATDVIRSSLERHGVHGAVAGLLRLETAATVDAMTSTLTALGLPADHVRAVDAARASALAGISLRYPAWHYPGGGWVDPAGLARAYLASADRQLTGRLTARVQALQPIERAGRRAWRLLDPQGATLAEAPTVVLANAGDALRLLGSPRWPIEPIRGQLSVWPARHRRPDAALRLPRIPVAGSGYLLPDIHGAAVFGATAQRLDDDPSVRRADHEANLTRLEDLLGHCVDVDPDELDGRTAWRWSSRDRLPVIGAVPQAGLTEQDADGAPTARLDQPRLVPRQPGLFVFTALGSRGIAWSTLGARVLAACIAGAPVPLEAAVIDAIDPARFVSRATRKQRAG